MRHRVREELVCQHLPGVDHHRQASHEHEAELVVTNVGKTVGIIFLVVLGEFTHTECKSFKRNSEKFLCVQAFFLFLSGVPS